MLIQKIEKESVEKAMEELDEWVSFWFEWYRPWTYIDVNQQCIIWTRWLGVSLQAWSPRFFDEAFAKIGMVLKIQNRTKLRERLDKAMVQISTGLQSVNRILRCRVDGAFFKIRIEEVRSSENLFLRSERRILTKAIWTLIRNGRRKTDP